MIKKLYKFKESLFKLEHSLLHGSLVENLPCVCVLGEIVSALKGGKRGEEERREGVRNSVTG